jgi:hypothetical protein
VGLAHDTPGGYGGSNPGLSDGRLVVIVAPTGDPVDLPAMDPRTRPDELDGADCAVCRRPVPADRIRLLAERDDLVFAELDCPSCGSVGLSIIVLRDGVRHPLDDQTAAPPIDESDVVAVRAFLDDYRGDLRALIDSRRNRSGAA